MPRYCLIMGVCRELISDCIVFLLAPGRWGVAELTRFAGGYSMIDS
jgi:hypothetical protein